MKNSILLRRISRILLISLLIFCTVAPFSLSVCAKSDNITIKYTVKLEKIRDDIAHHIKKGDNVIEAVSKKSLGYVDDLRFENCFAEIFSHTEKKYVLSEYEGYSNILVTLCADAYTDGSSFSVNGYVLKIGREISLRFPDFYGVGKCISVSVQKETSP